MSKKTAALLAASATILICAAIRIPEYAQTIAMCLLGIVVLTAVSRTVSAIYGLRLFLYGAGVALIGVIIVYATTLVRHTAEPFFGATMISLLEEALMIIPVICVTYTAWKKKQLLCNPSDILFFSMCSAAGVGVIVHLASSITGSTAYAFNDLNELVAFGTGSMTPWIFVLFCAVLIVIDIRRMQAYMKRNVTLQRLFQGSLDRMANIAKKGMLPKGILIGETVGLLRVCNAMAWESYLRIPRDGSAIQEDYLRERVAQRMK